MLKLNRVLNKRSGFLLLEVLVSITVISMGLVYIVRSFSSSTRAIETATRFLKSVSLAEEKMWELEAKGAVKKGRDEGRFKEDENFRWRIEAEGLRDVPINVLKLKVEWKGVAQKTQRVSLETYLWNEEE